MSRVRSWHFCRRRWQPAAENAMQDALRTHDTASTRRMARMRRRAPPPHRPRTLHLDDEQRCSAISALREDRS